MNTATATQRAQIVDMVNMTNNGKLMRNNIPVTLHTAVSVMLAEGALKRATFINVGDSIRLA